MKCSRAKFTTQSIETRARPINC